MLSRLLFCVGQIAFLQMVHCEVVVAMELKNKRASDDARKTSGKTPTSTRKVSYQCWEYYDYVAQTFFLSPVAGWR